MSTKDFATRIEFYLNEAQRSIELSKQLLELDKRKEALEKLSSSKKFIDSTAYYRSLLIIVDAQNNTKLSQGERINELLNEIAKVQAKTEDAKLVFVTGTESIQNQATEIIIPRLQTMLSENNITITENENEAGFVLRIDAKVCNPRSDEHFHYASTCVKVTFTNAKTGKNEITITVNGRKEGALNEYNAGERAFKSAAVEVWAKIKDKILEVCL